MANNEKSQDISKKDNSETALSLTAKDPKKKEYFLKTKKWRVKLYYLNENGQWDDFGIGYVFCANEQTISDNQGENNKKCQKLIMLKEDTNEEMFNVEISKDSVEFHNQRGIIITWKNGSDAGDDNTAISFQEKEGVVEIWNNILINQGKNPLDKDNSLKPDGQYETYLEVSIQNLPNLLRELNTDMNELKINNFISFLKKSNFEFIHQLGELFKYEEKKLEELKSSISTETNYTVINKSENNKKDEENTKNIQSEKSTDSNMNNKITSIEKHVYKSPCMENINYIFNIFKNLLLLGNKELIEILLDDSCYLITFGALEYDFEVFKIVPHRKYFKEVVKFKNPLNIDDEEILQKINLNIRLSYLRDTALARVIDNTTIKAINFIIQLNSNDIIQFFVYEERYMNLLFEQLQDEDILVQKDAFSLFSELINCSKDVYQTRVIFNETLCESGIFSLLSNIFKDILNNKYINPINLKKLNENEIHSIQEKIINISIEIIMSILTVMPYELKMYLKSNNIFNQLTILMINSENFGIKYEISQIYKILSESIDNKDLNNESFSNLLNYLKVPVDQNKKNEISSTKQIIIEILINIFSQNNFDTNFWLEEKELDKIILKLFEENNKIVNLYTIKLLKCLLDYTDKIVCNKVFSKEICDKLIQLFKDNIKNNNIIISCLYDFFNDLNQKSDEIFNLVIDKEKDFFFQSEYKLFFKNITLRLENKPKEEKHLISYIKSNAFKDYESHNENNINNIKESEEKPIDNINNEEHFYNSNIDDNNSNNFINFKLDEESKIKYLEKKRKRTCGDEADYDDLYYYNDGYLNEYEENEICSKKRKKSFSIFEEDDEDFHNIYENILENENKINCMKDNEEDIKSNKFEK